MLMAFSWICAQGTILDLGMDPGLAMDMANVLLILLSLWPQDSYFVEYFIPLCNENRLLSTATIGLLRQKL